MCPVNLASRFWSTTLHSARLLLPTSTLCESACNPSQTLSQTLTAPPKIPNLFQNAPLALSAPWDRHHIPRKKRLLALPGPTSTAYTKKRKNWPHCCLSSDLQCQRGAHCGPPNNVIRLTENSAL